MDLIISDCLEIHWMNKHLQQNEQHQMINKMLWLKRKGNCLNNDHFVLIHIKMINFRKRKT